MMIKGIELSNIISAVSIIISLISLFILRRASKRLNIINSNINNTFKTGDSIDLARRNIAEAIDNLKISMFDEMERLVGVKNSLERDLEKNPNNAMVIAKLEEIKRLIKVASIYYEVDVIWWESLYFHF